MEERNEQSGRRRRYSSEEQELAIKLYEESGLGVEAFCEREGILVRNFERWLVRRREDLADFVEVEAEGSRRARVEAGCRYRLGFEGGSWLEIAGEFEAGEVRVLADIVREGGSSSC